MVLGRIVNPFLRFLQLASALIVIGIIGHYLLGARVWPASRFIYTELVASMAAFIALVLIIPSIWDFSLYPLDFFMFLLWIIAFGLICDYIGPLHCGTTHWRWAPVYRPHGSIRQRCHTWKTALAFMFISAMLWLASGFIALWVTHRARTRATGPKTKWYRSHV